MKQMLERNMRSNDLFKEGGYYSMFVRADGNDPVEKENLIMHEREDKARVNSVNKRKGTHLVLE